MTCTIKGFKRLKRFSKLRVIQIFVIIFGGLLSIPLINQFSKQQNVFADNFYSSGGDIAECKMAFTAAIQIQKLSESRNINGITFDASKVKGVSNNWIQSKKFTDTGTYLYPNAHRYPEVASEVALPPNSTVDLGVFFANFSGHDIKVASNSAFYMSKENSSSGDVTRLSQSSYGNYSSNWKAFGKNLSRQGKGFNFGNLNIPSSESNGNGKIIHSFQTLQPLVLTSRSATVSYEGPRLVINVTNVIKNQSSYVLPNINVKEFHPIIRNMEMFNENFNFNPGESKTISYQIRMGDDYPLELSLTPLQITDPNSHTESMVTTGDGKDSLNVFIMRNDSNAPNNYLNQAVTTDPGRYGDYLKLTLIPYILYSNELKLTLSPNIELKKQVNLDEVRVGETLEYIVQVKNTGARDDNVVITDVVDKSLDNVQVIDGTFDSSTRVITWKLGRMDHDQIKFAKFKAVVKNGTSNMTVIKNKARVKDTDSNEVITIVRKPELEIKKEVDKSTASLSEILTYKIIITNKGSTDENVKIQDSIPQYTKFIETSKGRFENGVIYYETLLKSKTSDSVVVKVQINDDVPNGTVIRNIAILKNIYLIDLTSEAQTKISINPTLVTTGKNATVEIIVGIILISSVAVVNFIPSRVFIFKNKKLCLKI